MTDDQYDDELDPDTDYDLDQDFVDVPVVEYGQHTPAQPSIDERDHEGQEDPAELEGLGGPGEAPHTPAQAIKLGYQWIKTTLYVGIGRCLQNQRTLFGVAAKYMSAAESWAAAPVKHRVSSGSKVPRGVFVYWTGGSQGYGHITLSIGGGRCITNDFGRYGYMSVANIDDITRGWGQTLAGWSPYVNDVRCWTPNKPKQTAPKPQHHDHKPAHDPSHDGNVDEAIRVLGRARKHAWENKNTDRARTLTAAIKPLLTLNH